MPASQENDELLQFAAAYEAFRRPSDAPVSPESMKLILGSVSEAYLKTFGPLIELDRRTSLGDVEISRTPSRLAIVASVARPSATANNAQVPSLAARRIFVETEKGVPRSRSPMTDLLKASLLSRRTTWRRAIIGLSIAVSVFLLCSTVLFLPQHSPQDRTMPALLFDGNENILRPNTASELMITPDNTPDIPAHNVDLSTDESLHLRQSKTDPLSLVGSLPKSSNTASRLVIVYLSPESKKNPRDVILMPEGDLGKAIASSLMRSASGDEVHQADTFKNGSFDYMCRTNSFGNRGVYAVTNVTDKEKNGQIGSCTTYFDLRQWATKEQGVFEVPLPTPASERWGEYLPKNCRVHAWLIEEDGKPTGHAEIIVKRR